MANFINNASKSFNYGRDHDFNYLSSLIEKDPVTDKPQGTSNKKKNKEFSRHNAPRVRSNSINIAHSSSSSRLTSGKIKYHSFTMILFSCLGYLITKVYNYCTDISSILLSFYIGFYLIMFSILFIYIDNINLKKSENSQKSTFNSQLIDAFFLRGIIGGCYIVFITMGLMYLKLSMAAVIIFLNPIITNIIHRKIKKDKIQKFEVICMLSVIAGLILSWMIDLDLSGVKMVLGITFTLISVLLQSINYIMDIKLNVEFHPYYINLSIGVLLVTICPIILSVKGESFEQVDLSMQILSIALGGSYFYAIYNSVKITGYGEAILFTRFNLMGVVIMLLGARMLLNESISLADSFLGFMILVISLFRYLYYKSAY